jgi:hypothetical protein
MKNKKDYYEILGINPNATLSEIREAYRRLAILNHPDRNPTPQAAARMQEINEAYKILGNINYRRKYDFERTNSPATAQTNSFDSTRNSTAIRKSQQSFTQDTKAPSIISYSLSTVAFLVFFFSFLAVSGLLLLVLASNSNNYAIVTPSPSPSSFLNLTRTTGKPPASNIAKTKESTVGKVVTKQPILIIKATSIKAPPPSIITPTPSLRLNPSLAAMPASVHTTVTPYQLKNPVCASYFQTPQSSDFIQGTWTDDLKATKSMQACYEWMENAIFNKQNCAQPQGKSIMVVLINKSRHHYDLPDDLNFNSEFVAQKDCSQ